MSDQTSCPKCHTTGGIIEKPILVDTNTGELLYANKFQPIVMWGITIVFIPIGIYALVVLTMAVARNDFSNLLSQVALAVMAFGFGSIGLRGSAACALGRETKSRTLYLQKMRSRLDPVGRWPGNRAIAAAR